MSNTIEISAQFDFRGQTHTPRATLELDALLERGEAVPDFHQRLAIENGIDLYSYEYEVLESSELHFSAATGLALEFFHDGVFDFEGFRRRWQHQRALQRLEQVAQRHLGVEDLAQDQALSAALLEAYRLGREERE